MSDIALATEPAAVRTVPSDFPAYLPGLPVIGPTLGVMRDPLGYHLEAYRRHGPIYRTTFFGHETLCLGGLEANAFIWSNANNWDYGTARAVFGEQFGKDYLTQLDGEKHKKKRVRLNPAFRPDFLMRASGGMSAALNQNLAAAAGTEVELRRFCYKILIRMTSTALLGLTLPPEVEDAILLVERDLLIGAIFGPIRRTWLGRPAYLEAKQTVMTYLGGLVDRWQGESAPQDNMFAAAIRKQPEDEPLSREELVGDLYLLLTGGLNSTANLALWSMMYIWSRPDWLAQLREEVAAVPPAEFSAMKQWPKIKATVLEIERLRPATPLSTLLAAQDFEFQGVKVPKGTAITHFLTLPHYLPEIFAEPDAFRPERFMGDMTYPSKAHVAFGGGVHVCIGMPLARLQVPLIIGNVVANYDVEFLRKPTFRARMGSALTPAARKIPAALKARA